MMEEPKEELLATIESTKHTASAKEISKWSMVIAALWIGGFSLCKALWGIIAPGTVFGLEMSDIIFSGLALAGVFTPVYFSIIMDKVKEIKLGNASGSSDGVYHRSRV
jgi:hypothetical protein